MEYIESEINNILSERVIKTIIKINNNQYKTTLENYRYISSRVDKINSFLNKYIYSENSSEREIQRKNLIKILEKSDISDIQKQIINSFIFIDKLPHVDLHCHFEGAASIEYIKSRLKKYNASKAEQKLTFSIYQKIKKGFKSLNEFNKYYSIITYWIRDKEDIKQLTEDIIDNARKLNIYYLELRISLLGLYNLNPEEIINAILEGIKIKCKNNPFPIITLTNLIYRGIDISSDIRNKTKEEQINQYKISYNRMINNATEMAKLTTILAQKYEGFITGIDIAGPENHSCPDDFQQVFNIIKAYNIKNPNNRIGITIHVGETSISRIAQQNKKINSLLCIEQAINLDVDRISHITSLVIALQNRTSENDNTIINMINLIKRKNILIELLQTSNLLGIAEQTDNITKLQSKVLDDYYINYSLCSDDPVIFSTNVVKEYKIDILMNILTCKNPINKAIKTIHNSINKSFLPLKQKKILLTELKDKTK